MFLAAITASITPTLAVASSTAFDILGSLIEAKPVNFYKLMKKIYSMAFDIGEDSFEKEYNEKIDFFNKYDDIIYKNGGGSISDSKYNYGDDQSNFNTSPGSSLGISAQDLLGDNLH